MNSVLLDGFLLGDRSVDPATGTVSSGGKSVHLTPRAVEVLLLLASHPHELVTRDALRSAISGDRQGSPEAITHAISEIRHALGDDPAAPAYVETIPRHGYRLLVEPELRDAAGSGATGQVPRRGVLGAMLRHGVVQATTAYLVVGWLLLQVADTTFDHVGLPAWTVPFTTFVVLGGIPLVILLSWFLDFPEGRFVRDRGERPGGWFEGLDRNYLAIFMAYGLAVLGAGVYQATVGFATPGADTAAEPGLIPVEQNSLAVLRFIAIGPSERAQVFGDALSEDILEALARVPGLAVSSRGDAWSLPPNAASNQVRRRLRVSFFLEGSVRLVENQVRVVAQLIDSATGFHVMSRSFDHELDEFFEVQKGLTQLVVANLRVALPGPATDSLTHSSAETRLDAYELYRRGRDELHKPRSREAVAQGLALFGQALAIDPGYPAAHAGQCTAHTILFRLDGGPDDIAAAETACAKALETGARLPLVLTALGSLYAETGKLDLAESAFAQALDLDRQHVPAIKGLASVTRERGDLAGAERLMQRAVELQPGNWRSLNELGNLYFRNGDYRGAEVQYRRAAWLDPGNHALLSNAGSASLMAGDYPAARDALERSLAISVSDRALSNLGIVHYYLGDFPAAVAIHREVVTMSPSSGQAWANLGDALSFAGDGTGARDAFARAAEFARQRLSVAPQDPEALTLLAWSLSMTGFPIEALTYAEHAVAVDPADPYSYYYLALLHTRAGRAAEAIEALRQAVKRGYAPTMLSAEPHLASLRSVPGFSSLMAGQPAEGAPK